MNWLNELKEFNTNYANAIQAITPIVLAVASALYYKLYKESKMEQGDAASIVNPVFWTLGTRYKILAVHKLAPTADGHGYSSMQYSGPDQWKQLIDIKRSGFGFKYEVTPKNDTDILEVVISRNGTEKWKVIAFNKYR